MRQIKLFDRCPQTVLKDLFSATCLTGVEPTSNSGQDSFYNIGLITNDFKKIIENKRFNRYG